MGSLRNRNNDTRKSTEASRALRDYREDRYTVWVRDSDFYDQMQFAAGVMHVFTYNFIDDVVDYFAQLLNEALR